jgi:uncharacterized damage-inducible protein DinB
MLKEIETYLSIYHRLRKEIKTVLEGLPSDALDWQPIQGEGELATNSIAVMLAHVAGSEAFFINEIIGRQKIQRDRPAEFSTKGVSLQDLNGRLEAAAKVTETALAALTPAQLEEPRKFREESVTVRWAIVLLIEHIAMHLGHMQLTRQLWMARAQKK